jgi:hypothetical protein
VSDASGSLFAQLEVARGGAEPPYQQIARFVHDAVVRGDLPPGTMLPAERDLARQLGVGRATVARALSELAATGLLDRRVGRGTLVAFDLETWRAGPTAGIPWGALLNALPRRRLRRGVAADVDRRAAAECADAGDRGAESIVLASSVPDATRFLVEVFIGEGDRVIVGGGPSSALATSLTLRGATVIELPRSGSLAGSLERVVAGRTGAKLVWLRDAGSSGMGELAHALGLMKREGLPAVIERPSINPLQLDPHDHVIVVGRARGTRAGPAWISAPAVLARHLAALAIDLGVGEEVEAPDG